MNENLKNAIIIAPTMEGTVSINQSGERLKGTLLEMASRLTEVDGDDSRMRTVMAASMISKHLKAVEVSRKEIKEPYFRVGKAIDEAATTYKRELLDELTRLNNLVTDFDQHARQEIERIGKEVEERRLASIAKAKHEEEAALAAADQLEERVKEIRAKGTSVSDQLESELMIDQLDATARFDQARENLAHAVQQANAPMPPLDAPVTVGQGGRTTVEIELEITDIRALLNAYPHCVKLVPQIANIKAMIRNGISLPGVKATAWDKFKAQ